MSQKTAFHRNKRTSTLNNGDERAGGCRFVAHRGAGAESAMRAAAGSTIRDDKRQLVRLPSEIEEEEDREMSG